MKMLRIGIASYEEMKARTLAIARGQLKPKATDPKVWFPSTESLVRVLSDKNRSLLATIRDSQPQSLSDLAELTGRKKSNLSRTLKTMERYGIVKLERKAKGRVVPHVPYAGVTVDMALEGSAVR
ncbi:MAG: MarR family transcriptional regulator [Candidatus Korobacteraceae bacterium]|jgi:predicted transcriptional regulator